MNMHEMMSTNIGNLALALSKMQGTVGLIPKTKTATIASLKTGTKYEYSYADLADIWDAIRHPLKDNELSVTQLFSMQDNKGYITTILMHSSGEWLKSILELDAHEKIQELGSEITYLRRYGISSILGIATDEDEDGKLANDAGKKPKVNKEDPEVINTKELQEMKNLIEKLNKPNEENYICKIAKISSLDRFPKYKYEDAINYLERQIESKNKPKEVKDEQQSSRVA